MVGHDISENGTKDSDKGEEKESNYLWGIKEMSSGICEMSSRMSGCLLVWSQSEV